MQKPDTLFISGSKKDIKKLKTILNLDQMLTCQILIDKLQCPNIDEKLSNFDFKFKDPIENADGTTAYEIEASDVQKCYDRWNEDEQLKFIELFHTFGQKWTKISDGLEKQRSQKHCRTHGQKYIQSLNKLAFNIEEFLNQHNYSQNRNSCTDSLSTQGSESNSFKSMSQKDLCTNTKQFSKHIRKYETIRLRLLDSYREKNRTEYDISLFPEYLVHQSQSNSQNQCNSLNKKVGKQSQSSNLQVNNQHLSSNIVNSEYISQVKNIQVAIKNELLVHQNIQKLKESKKKRTRKSNTQLPQSENQEVSDAKSQQTKKRELKRGRKQVK